MHRPVAKDTDVRGVEKVRNAARFGNRLLRLIRQTVVAGGQGVEEAALKFRAGVCERAQLLEVCSPVAAADAGQRTAYHQIQQGLSNATAVELQGFELIVETHQALVTRRLALRLEIVALLVKVAPDERLSHDTGERVGFLHQPAQYASAAGVPPHRR